MVDLERIQIEPEWKEALKDEFLKPYFSELRERYIIARRDAKMRAKEVFPPPSLLFNAFNSTPFSRVRVVILGQDPYHNRGEAMGLCFSVPPHVRIPPSLKNIFRELERSLGIKPPSNGDLSRWCQEGVFLLNSILSVEEGKAGSHRNLGWQFFSDAAITLLSEKRENLFFLLWGNYAKEKKNLIDTTKHIVLESPHPSPLAGNRFVGNNHFFEVNDILRRRGEKEIQWRL